jgi:hypothetical protein
MRTEIERLKPGEAKAKYPPETKIACFLDNYFWNDEWRVESGTDLQSAWVTTMAWFGIHSWGDHVRVVVFTEEPPDPNAPVKKCQIEKVLQPTVLELLKLAPANPVARAHALNNLKRALPDECKTFDEIKAWVELNCEPKSPISPATAPSTRRRNTAFEIEVSSSEIESGTASYTCSRSGCNDVPITVEEIEEALNNATDLEGVVDALEEVIREKAGEYISMESSDFEYDNEELTGSDDYSTEWSRRTLMRLVGEWISDNRPNAFNDDE